MFKSNMAATQKVKVERMADDRLPKKATQLREQGRGRRGKTGRRRRQYRGGWERLSDEAMKKLRAAPHP